MKIAYPEIEAKEFPNFKGGEKSLMAKMFFDGKNRILHGKLGVGATIGMHCHDTSSEIIDNKVRYTMKSTGQNSWYQIVFKYKTGEVKNKNVGFDFGEISDHTYSWIQSMDYVYANNHNAAYEIIFSDKYSDPAIIQGDYDTVVSYADAIEEENNSDSVVKDAPITVKKVNGLNERADFIKGSVIVT